MARPVSSKLSIPDVVCSDGVKRAFRYYSATSTKGTVRVDGSNVAGDIRPSRYGGYFFSADEQGMNYYLLPNDNIVELVWGDILKLIEKAKAFGWGDPDPLIIARFLGMEVDEEQGAIEAPWPVPFSELEQGVPPTD